MDIGMLWYDDDSQRPLGEKVARAVDYYKTKYGSVPTVCFVNPAALKDAPDTAAGVQIRSARNVMVDHFWLGVGESHGPGNARGSGAHRKHGANSSEGVGRGQAAPAQSNGSRASRVRARSSAGRVG
jgi:hypothetical protein